MQLRLVQPAELREARAERDVDRPADLLVEEDVAREAVDLVVEPERQLAEDGRAGVHLEQRAEEVDAAGGLGRDHAPAFEAKPDVGDLAAFEDPGKAEADLAPCLGLDRAGEDLAVRHVRVAVGLLPLPPGDAERQIGVRPDDAQLADLLEPLACAELGRDPEPVLDGVVLTRHVTGGVDEVLVLLDRHLGVLRIRLDRLERAAPAQIAGRDPLPAALRELTPGGRDSGRTARSRRS